MYSYDKVDYWTIEMGNEKFRTMKLTKNQILEIPKLLETIKQKDIADKFGCHVQTIVYWVSRLKKEGKIKSSQKRGPRAINLK